MAGFAVNHNIGVFKYNFNHTSISEFRKINKVDIPFTSLEDWYVIYQLIPSRESKVKMIENYFLSNGIKNPILLKNSLKGNLPIEIQERVKKILGS
nr:hypothetical protein [Clostridium botulinum]